MTATDTKYVVDNKGRKKAVLLDIKEYSKLLKRLGDLEDALELDSAVKTAGNFREYSKIRGELVREGKL